MDRKSTEQARIEELIRRSGQARADLGLRTRNLKRKLDVPSRIVGSVRSRPSLWLAGSTAAGFFSSLVFSGRRRKPKSAKKDKSKRGNKFGIAALTLTAVKPLAKIWFKKKVRSLAESALERYEADRRSSETQSTPSQEHVRTPGPGSR